MTLVEALVASAVFAAATTSSVRIWSATAAHQQLLEQQQRAWQLMDADRLRLLMLWRRGAEPDHAGLLCAQQPQTPAIATLMAEAEALPPPPGLSRHLAVSADGTAVVVQWRVLGGGGPSSGRRIHPVLERRRQVTPAGLGRCRPGPVLG